MIYLVTTNNLLPNNDTIKIVSVEESLKYLEPLQLVGLDTETTGLDCWTKDLLSIQLGCRDFQVVVDCKTIDVSYYKEYLESDRLFIGWNLKFDLKFLYRKSIIPKKVYDENYDEIVNKEKQLIEVGKEMKRLSIAGEKGKEYQELYRKRLDIQEYLKGFIISIPLYEFRIYDKKFWEDFGNVSISRNEKVPIMKCHYDEKGFYPIDYENMEFKDEIMNV